MTGRAWATNSAGSMPDGDSDVDRTHRLSVGQLRRDPTKAGNASHPVDSP